MLLLLPSVEMLLIEDMQFSGFTLVPKIHIFNFKHDSHVGNNRRWISSAMTSRLWCCGFCRTVVKSDALERRKQLAGGGKKPEPVFEALVSFKRMWGGCYWKRQFSKCNSPALLLIGDLHCHETEVTNKGRPLPLLQPLLDQQVGHFKAFPFFSLQRASHLILPQKVQLMTTYFCILYMSTLRHIPHPLTELRN